MKANVRVSLAQFSPEWLTPEANASRMAEIVLEEAAAGAELIVFPELSNSGYIAPYHGFDPDFARKFHACAEEIPGRTTQILGEVAKATSTHVVVGLSQRHPYLPGSLFNTAVVIGANGRILGQQHKMHLPAGEKHYFTPGDRFRVIETDLARMGLSICYDGRFPETSRALCVDGAEIICSMWCRYYIPGYLEPEANYHMAYVRAQENAVFYLFCNRSGVEGDFTYLGHSAVGAPNGGLIARSETDGEDRVRGDLEAQRLIDARLFLSIYRDRRPEDYRVLSRPMNLSLGKDSSLPTKSELLDAPGLIGVSAEEA